MPGLSITRIAHMAAETEGLEANYGVDPTIVPANDGFLTIDSPNPAQPELRNNRFIPSKSTLAPERFVPAERTERFRFTIGCQGGADDETPPRYNDLLTCCALKETITPGTPGSVAYTLQDLDSLTSTAIIAQLGGYANSWLHLALGCVGNLIWRVNTQGAFFDFDGIGLFQVPTSGVLTGWAGGSNNMNRGVATAAGNRFKINNGGSDYFGVVHDFTFDLGIQIEEVLDINSVDTFGIYRQLIVDHDPRVRVNWALDTDPVAEVTYKDFYEDADDGTLSALNYTYTDLAGRTISLDINQAQVISVRPDQNGRRRVAAVELMPLDFSITFA